MTSDAVTILRMVVDNGCWAVCPHAVRCFYCGAKEDQEHVDCVFVEAARFFGEDP